MALKTTEEYSVFEGTIRRSATDDRQYRHITLKNDLRGLLISDPSTEKSSACCAVNVGSLCDPPDAQGLAHFLEHMLFMGTEKYPVENAYSAFLNSHGGFSNAYTSQEETVYYFDVQNDALEGALDLFASFFTCPLFTESGTMREINAVDSENTKNLQSDTWRKFQLFKSLARDGHPLNSFSTGNLQTLGKDPEANGKNIRDMMIEFYKQHYSANLMRVVVYGKESLDVLEAWTAARFAEVPNQHLQPASFPKDPFPPTAVQKMLEVVPIRDTKKLNILFPIPAVKHLFRSKPTRLLSHMIGHESAGSILSSLKKKMWANGLSAGNYSDCRDFACFAVTIDMSDDGVEHVDEIVGCVFAYVSMLQHNILQHGDWIWQEMKEVEEMNFRFLNKSEPSSYAVQLANSMLTYPPELTLCGDYLLFEKDMELSMDYLKYMEPNNCIVVNMHQGFTGKTSLKEKWYLTDYNKRQLTEEQLMMWKRCRDDYRSSAWADEVFLPQPNPFIATDFELRTALEEPMSMPKLIQNIIQATLQPSCMLEGVEDGTTATDDEDASAEAKLPVSAGTKLLTWHMQDKLWLVPKLNVKVALENLVAGCNPLNIALTEVFCSCLKENLNEYSYYADCAGLYYDVQLAKGGIDVALQGYGHKMPTLAAKIVEEIKRIGRSGSDAVPVPLYERMREKALRNFKNILFSQPYYHCILGALQCLEDPRFDFSEKYRALEASSYEDFLSFCHIFVQRFKSNVLVHGNITAEESTQLTDMILSVLDFDSLPQGQAPTRRVVELSSGSEYIFRTHAAVNNPAEVNSAVENIYVAGLSAGAGRIPSNLTGDSAVDQLDTSHDAVAMEAMLELLVHMMSEPAFDQLRTKEQLGYIVFTGIKRLNQQVLALHIIVQSSHKDPEYLDERIESFISQYRKYLSEECTAEELQTNIEAVIEKLLEKPKNIDQESDRYWAEIKNGMYWFERKKHLALLLQRYSSVSGNDGITTASLVQFIDKFLSCSPARRKLSSQFYGKGTKYQRPRNTQAVVISEPSTFRQSMPLQPVPIFDPTAM